MLDVAIGLSFMFFVLSIVCSSLNEGIATALNWRAKNLEQWLGSVLADPTQLDKVTPAVKQVLGAASVPDDVQNAIVPRVAAAAADTSSTIAAVKGKITNALNDLNLSKDDVDSLTDKVFAAAQDARRAPSAPSSSEARSAHADVFFSHPAVQPLVKPSKGSGGKGRRPSYVPSSTFATVLLNQATGGHATTATPGQVIAHLPAVVGAAVTDIGHEVKNVTEQGAADLEALRQKIEQWYDTSMQRVAGWYKRKVQLALTIIALIVSVGLNADSIGVANSLWSDTTLRSVIVADAGHAVSGGSPSGSSQDLTTALDQAKQLHLPLGWGHRGSGPSATPHGLGSWLSKIAGILITTFALTLGAPFWFDILGRLVQFKGSGAKPPSTLGASATAPGTAGAAHG